MYHVERVTINEREVDQIVWYLAEGTPTIQDIAEAVFREFPATPQKDLHLHFRFFPDQKGLFALNAMVLAPM